MSQYAFYTSILRFVSRKTGRDDTRVAAMMDLLEQAANEIDAKGSFDVRADNLESTARAFAGVAGFLQKQILPEAVAAGNKAGENQIRWAIDTSMENVNTLLGRAAVLEQKTDMEISLPAAP